MRATRSFDVLAIRCVTSAAMRPATAAASAVTSAVCVAHQCATLKTVTIVSNATARVAGPGRPSSGAGMAAWLPGKRSTCLLESDQDPLRHPRLIAAGRLGELVVF